MLRIMGGTLKGSRLKSLKGLATRPVQARIREALFSIIGPMDGLRFLDLFAGTGAVGIEALSRGAAEAVFVENGAGQCRIITDNLNALGLSARVIRADVLRTIERPDILEPSFDVVFADPPYEKGLSQKAVKSLLCGELLSPQAILAVTVRRNEKLPDASPGTHLAIDRAYGDTRLAAYVKRPDIPGK